MSMSDETIKSATEITVAAMGPSAQWISNAAGVATFFETVARKIDELRHEEDK